MICITFLVKLLQAPLIESFSKGFIILVAMINSAELSKNNVS